MKTMKIENIEVKTHNQREEKLVRIINRTIEDCKKYIEENTFGDNTLKVIKRNMTEIDGMLTGMFFMEMLVEPVMADQLDFFNDCFSVSGKLWKEKEREIWQETV